MVLRSVELFGGAGGLALGVSAAGFRHDAVIEKDGDAFATLQANKSLGIQPIADWPIFHGDVKTFDYAVIPEGVDVLAGGPPCQPFSIGGKHHGPRDERNLFPEAVRAVRELKPRAFIFENVRGLMRQSFATYFEYIKLQLTYPTVSRKEGENWTDHLRRLEQHLTSSPHTGLRYNVVAQILNAVDFGIPQKRERVFIVGFRWDLDVQWSFPKPTHSSDSLLWSQWVTGDYWDLHKVPKRKRAKPSNKLKTKIELVQRNGKPNLERWQTVRDAIWDLPNPKQKQVSIILNHNYQPGARVYKGHTGSPLDEPAKTLKAGDHGVPGGENMLAIPDIGVRYFTVRESARLQTFPDDVFFPGSWTEAMRQLGNAVPMKLSQIVAEGVRCRLTSLISTKRAHSG